MSDLTEGTIKLPGIGPTKKVYVLAAGGVVALGVAYVYYRRANSGDTEAPTEDYAGTGTTGEDGYAGASGSVSGTAGSDAYDALPATPTTDQQWVALVTDSLSYLEPGYLVEVLGKYLDRKALTADEASVIRSAWAVAGHPPGNQPIILATDNGSPGTVTLPAVPSGLKVASTTATSVGLSWSSVASATKYRLYGPDTAVREVSGTLSTVTGLAASKGYTFSVSAVNAAGESAKSASVTATTKAPATGTPTPTKTSTKPAGYKRVTVKKYTDKNPPWESTISGIAGHYHKTTAQVWNYSKNASLRSKRKEMNKIQAGDYVYVPQ